MINGWWWLADGVADRRARFEGWMLGERHGLRSVAAVRIGTGMAVLGLLLANFTTRDIWVGQASVWADPARSVSSFPELALLRGVSGEVLTVVYLITVVAAAALVAGWHTKAANTVAFVGFIAIVGQNPIVGIEGDNLIRLTLLWLLLTRAGDRWSLDARRRDLIARGGAEAKAYEADVMPSWLTNLLHHAGLVALAMQTIISYTSAGLDKVAQPQWQDGTALYYTMQLPESRPFPALSDLLSSNQLLLALLTYAVLLVQLFFAPLLIARSSRWMVVVAAVVVSVLFAVLFAAPWSQLAVVAVTVLFVSDDAWQRVEDRVLDVSDAVVALFDRRPSDIEEVRDVVRDGVDAVVERARSLAGR